MSFPSIHKFVWAVIEQLLDHLKPDRTIGSDSISILRCDWLDRAVASLGTDRVLQASAEVMEDVDSLGKKVRRKRQGGQEEGEGGVRLGGELHAHQLVLQVIVVLRVRNTSPSLINCLYLDRKLAWQFWNGS